MKLHLTFNDIFREDRSRWTKGATGRDENNVPCPSYSFKCRKWSLIGAVCLVSFANSLNHKKLMDLMEQAFRSVFQNETESVFDWAEKKSTTYMAFRLVCDAADVLLAKAKAHDLRKIGTKPKLIGI